MNDQFVVRAVVISLGVNLWTIVLGCILLTFNNHALPDSLIAIGSGCLGALAAFLVSAKLGASDTQPVQVVNSANSPVPVDQAS